MEYMIGSRNGGCPDPYPDFASACADAKQLSIEDPTEWFDVIDEQAQVVAVWHDGKGYNQCESDETEAG